MKHHATLLQVLANIPGGITPQWPTGERFAAALAHGSMSVELYVPLDNDPQQPHAQDELYIVVDGAGVFELEGVPTNFSKGDVIFVQAGKQHSFKQFSDDFKTWVVFWGPRGGENSLNS